MENRHKELWGNGEIWEKAKKVANIIVEMAVDIERRTKRFEMVKCKYCGSENVVKFGTYKGVQRWWCKDCKRKFIDTDALYKMKTPIRQIASALSGYYGGMSLNAICRHLEQQYETSFTDAGIYTWLIRFTKDAIKEAKKHTPDVGKVWVADETVLKIGGKNTWFWDIIDAKTRFLLASHISQTRTIKDARTLMEEASKRAGNATPDIILTDKLSAYLEGIERTFGADTKHIPIKGLTARFNTNLIERFHGTLKDRTKVMRGLKKLKTSKLLLNGWLVQYNFFRPHEALGDRTPAEKAGIKFPFKDWMDVVRGVKGTPAELDSEADHLTYSSRDRPLRRKRRTKPKISTRPEIVLKGVR